MAKKTKKKPNARSGSGRKAVQLDASLLRKIGPKLRMFMNGSSEVNAVRAEHACAICVATDALSNRVKLRRQEGDRPALLREVKKPTLSRGHLEAVPGDIEASVFVDLVQDDGAAVAVPGTTAKKANLVTARVPLNQVSRIAAQAGVAQVELGETLVDPKPIIAADRVDPPSAGHRRFGSPARHKYGKEVLVGIIDVNGFDFAHPDFLDSSGKTRFLRIWDQGASVRPAPKGFSYGAEFTKIHLDLAIQRAPGLGVPAQDLEPQSERVPGSHGTHVASIAAGNLGVCRNAGIVGVLVSLPPDEWERRRSFYDSTRIAHAVDYIHGVASELGFKAVSINVSLGTNGHAHDGSNAICRWIDASLTTPGRAVCVAAGNAGQEASTEAGDIGWVMGRIHTGGRVAARGLDVDVEWVVAGNGIADISENELEIWYEPQDRFAVSIRTPRGEWIGPVEPGEFIENHQLKEEKTFLSVYNQLYHQSNGCNYVAVYLSPLLKPEAVVGVPAGTWIVRIHGREVRHGGYHAWIERDDPRRAGRIGPSKEAWSFPSFFSERSNVDRSSVSSLGCAERIVCVANLDVPQGKINVSSSQGPTRDGKEKPDVAAPGTGIVAANGFAGSSDRWIAMTGTSMASPFVTGVVGLMLATEPRLTAAQIVGILKRTSRPLPGTDFAWRDDAGFGVIDPEACLAEAATAFDKKDRTPK